MIKFAIIPVHGVMAGLARQRKARLDVIRVRGLVVVLLMTGDATRLVELVIVIDVAIGASARWDGVRPGQRPSSLRMIELAVHPVDRVMTGFTGSGETGRDMVNGLLGVVVILLMAGDARSLGQVVIVVDMAIRAGAGRHGMAASQREFGFIVFKLSRLPGVGRMAYFASLGEAALYVVRVLAVLEILQVTGDAGSLSQIVVAVDVTISALARRNGMGASQRESGFGVIEVRRRPGYRRVASLASLRESLLRVVRIICFLKILQVARDAGSLSQVVVVVNVAIGARARRHSMCTCQGKPSQRMIKAGIQPIIG